VDLVVVDRYDHAVVRTRATGGERQLSVVFGGGNVALVAEGHKFARRVDGCRVERGHLVGVVKGRPVQGGVAFQLEGSPLNFEVVAGEVKEGGGG